jgi:hypothetical protein
MGEVAVNQVLDLRITRWQMKLLYAIIAYGVVFVIARVPDLVGAPTLVGSIAAAVFSVVAILLGARIFRVKGEEIAPPRAWWRMTGRAKLSRRIATLAIIGVVFITLDVIVTVVYASLPISARHTHPQSLSSIPELVVIAIEYAIVAALYVNSAKRLQNEKLLEPIPVPKFTEIP